VRPHITLYLYCVHTVYEAFEIHIIIILYQLVVGWIRLVRSKKYAVVLVIGN
jgi:hypothetical protein